jgi:hypothetical protein
MTNVYGSATPPNVNGTTTGPRGVLTNFAVTADASLTGVRFYSVASMSTDVITVIVYAPGVNNQTQLSTFTFTPNGTVGWHTYNLPTPVALTAGSVYTLLFGLETGTIKYGYTLGSLPITVNGITFSNTAVRTGASNVWAENQATALTDTDAYSVDIEVGLPPSNTGIYVSTTSSTGWTANGGSLPGLLSDASDSSYMRTSNNPVNVIYDGNISPVTVPPAGTGVTVTFRARRNNGTTGTIQAQLYENTTLISTQTVNVTSSTFTNVSVTFPATDVDDATTGAWATGMRLVLTANAS